MLSVANAAADRVHKRSGSASHVAPAVDVEQQRPVSPMLQPQKLGNAGHKSRMAGCLVVCWLLLVVFALATVFIAMGLISRNGGTERHSWIRAITPPLSPNNVSSLSPTALWPVVAVCHPRWHGIRAATYQLGTAVIEIADLNTPAAQGELAAELLAHGTRVVVFNGVIPGTLAACASLRRTIPQLKTALTFHGSFAQHAMTSEGILLTELVAATHGDVAVRPLWRLGMLKESNAWWLREFAHAQALPLANVRRPLGLRLGKFSDIDGLMHVGVFSKNSALKNVVNQLAAACSLGPSVVVHTIGLPREAPYIAKYCPGGVVVHGGSLDASSLANFDMMLLMSAMDANLYVSLTECHPMVVMESIAAGTPCIASDVSTIYDDSPDLRAQLVVRKHEDVADISATLTRVLANISALTAVQSDLLDSINDRALRLWSRFLNETLPAIPRAPRLLPPQPKPSLLFPKPSSDGVRPPKVCFTTYELGGETGGGMGTLLTGLLRDLSASGAHSVVVADVPWPRINRWKHYLASEGIENVTVYNVPLEASFWNGEVPIRDPNVLPESFLFVEKAGQFARALASVQKQEHCDIIEVFEYAGVGYELLRSRKLYLGDTAENGQPRIVVRAHGSLTNIRMAEDTAKASSGRMFAGSLDAIPQREWPREASLIHGMELYAMLRADAVIVPSPTMGMQYARLYNFPNQRLFVIPPPLRDIVSPFAMLKSKAAVPLEKRLASTTYLAFGKQQLVKGTDLVVAAAVEWMRREGPLASFVFVGPDWLNCGTNRACLWNVIPSDLKDRFKFINHATPAEVAELATTVRCAVFASRYETLGIAAHEIYQLGVPIIVSHIPAYADHFTEQNAFTFDQRNLSSLVETLHRSFTDTAKLSRLSPAKPLEYPDRVSPLYIELLHRISEGQLAIGHIEREERALGIHTILNKLLRSSPNYEAPHSY